MTEFDAAEALGLSQYEFERARAMQRGANLVAVALALTAIFPRERAAAWMRKSKEAFQGRTAIELLVSPDDNDAALVRRYAEYWAYNGW